MIYSCIEKNISEKGIIKIINQYFSYRKNLFLEKYLAKEIIQNINDENIMMKINNYINREIYNFTLNETFYLLYLYIKEQNIGYIDYKYFKTDLLNIFIDFEKDIGNITIYHTDNNEKINKKKLNIFYKLNKEIIDVILLKEIDNILYDECDRYYRDFYNKSENLIKLFIKKKNILDIFNIYIFNNNKIIFSKLSNNLK